MHTGVKNHKCDICERSFSQNSGLNRHLRLHNGKKYKCDICKKSFSFVNELKQHNIKVHQIKEVFKIDAKKDIKYVEVIKISLKTEVLDCEFYEEAYNKIDVDRNLDDKSEDAETVDCVKAEKDEFKELLEFENIFIKSENCMNNSDLDENKCVREVYKKSLSQNVKVHTGKNNHNCPVCQKSFSHNGNLNRHLLLHAGKKKYKCSICEKSFTQKSHLNKHSLLHTGKNNHKCDICQKSFSEKSYLKTHLLLHSGKKNYKCDICEKSFAHEKSLKQHLIWHSGEKKFKCDICKKIFGQKRHLEEHILLHTGVKYKCDICEKSFSRKSHLKTHLLFHTGVKKYKCDNCKKSFSQKSDLNRHLVLHTGEKNYKCDICKKSFSVKGNLNRHFLLHTGVKNHKCDICKKSFSYIIALKQHIKVHHIKDFKIDEKQEIKCEDVIKTTVKTEVLDWEFYEEANNKIDVETNIDDKSKNVEKVDCVKKESDKFEELLEFENIFIKSENCMNYLL